MYLESLRFIVQLAILLASAEIVSSQPARQELRSATPAEIAAQQGMDGSLISNSSWWSTQHIVLVLGGMAISILAGAALVNSLRRRLLKQSEIIRQQLETEAVMEERYRELVKGARDFIYTHDLQGKISAINQAGETTIGYSSAEVLGMSFFDLVVPEQRPFLEQQLQSMVAGGTPASFELEMLAKGGRRVVLETSIRPIHQDGKLVEVQGSGRDIAEHRQSESQRLAFERNLQESHRLESLGLMAGGFAHDFNNLLTAILGNASLARTDLSPDSPTVPYLSEIEKTSLQAAELCNQMLTYSGMGRFEMQQTSLSSLVEGMKHLIEVSIYRKITITFKLAQDLLPVETDAAQILQVVLNLVINASEAIGDQPGTICVTTGNVRITPESSFEDYATQLPEPGNYIYLEVTDTGCGMDAETKAKIFHPFFTTKFTGRGLGLSALLGIVRGHNGALRVTSELARGSTFTLLLPSAPEEVIPETASAASIEGGWRGSGTILVVEDDPPVRRVIVRILESSGFTVLQAGDGLAGVETFQAHANDILMVVLDMTMPRMLGEEALAQMKAIRPDIPVILMSGYTEQEAANRLSKQDWVGFLQKPFKKENLMEKLRTILDSIPTAG